MKSLNNELFVHRNETFTIDKIIQNKDGSPYIISSELQHPAFLLTISNTRYEVNERYIYNRYLKLDEFPRFKNTTAVNLKVFVTEPNGTTSVYDDFDDITELTDTDNIEGYDGQHYTDVVAYGYIGNNFYISRVGDDVFYITNNEVRTYKYWKKNKGWTEYECRIVTPFFNTLTSKWIDQNYVYSINLVDVEITEEGEIVKPFSSDIPILTPTRLTVSSNINGNFDVVIDSQQGGN